MPAMTMPRLPSMMAASASARRTVCLPALGRRDEDRVVLLDRGRINDDLGVGRVFRAMLQMKTQTEPLRADPSPACAL